MCIILEVKGLKFSLLQLIVCVVLILFIAMVLIYSYNPPENVITAPIQPQVTLPFQEIKLK